MSQDVTSYDEPCPKCGHRAVLHGTWGQECWCIAWNGEKFCGCTIRSEVVVERSKGASLAR